MRLVIDALGATENSGGMALHARQVIRAWESQFPEDELIILAGPHLYNLATRGVNTTLIEVGNETALSRAWGQLITSAYEFHSRNADAILSLSPIVTRVVPSERRVCTIHDWRHLKNPQEFSFSQRLYRKLWKSSARSAGAVITISRKTELETRALVRHSKVVLIENGRDHLNREIKPSAETAELIVAYGHHTNKRPWLALDGFAKSADCHQASLTILGTSPELTVELRTKAINLGISKRVFLPGFVSDSEYERTLQQCKLVLLPSTDEGFGLPIAEAQNLGIPVVTTIDSGVREVFPKGPIYCEPHADSIASGILEAFLQNVNPWQGIKSKTWDEVASEYREILLWLLCGK